ncbi:polysaccharide deacetylase family protein [Paenibacillus hemerocallicola]|nr:polysaccharide deacetylase family protein [Paenibacillus hemerocallicola]
MKRMTAFVLCCMLASGCSIGGRQAVEHIGSPEPKAMAQIENIAAPGAEGQQLFAETAEQERRVAQTISVPPAPPVSQPEPAIVPQPTLKPETPKSNRSGQTKAPSVTVQKSQQIAGKKLSLPQLRAKYPDAFRVSGASKERNIALTFDDGPDERFTPQILDILKAHGVKATFFVLGKKAEAHPAIMKRMVREGHVIGNHSFRHPLFTKITVDQFAQEVEQTEEVLNRLIGYKPKLLRPPYGEIDEEQLQWAKSRGYVIVNWNVDSLDWKNLGEQQVSGNILGHTKAGAIVLQHSAGGDSQDLSGTVKALPGIISKLREQGYGLVTVSELLHLPKQK